MEQLSRSVNKERFTYEHLRKYRFHLIVTLLAASPVISGLVALYHYRSIFNSTELSKSHDDWGQFGDFFAGITNPVVGLVTIVLLVWTLVSQQRELKEQRNSQAKAAFQSTFFTMVDKLVDAIDRCTGVAPDGDDLNRLSGEDLLRSVMSWDGSLDLELYRLVEDIDPNEQNNGSLAARAELATWLSRYAVGAGLKHNTKFSRTSRILHQIMITVHREESLRPIDKKRLIDFLKAVLPAHFLQFILLAHASAKPGQFHALCRTYSLFSSMETATSNAPIFLCVHLKAHQFHEAAFGKSTGKAATNKGSSWIRRMRSLSANPTM